MDKQRRPAPRQKVFKWNRAGMSRLIPFYTKQQVDASFRVHGSRRPKAKYGVLNVMK